MAPQLLRCKGFAVNYYSFTLYALDLRHFQLLKHKGRYISTEKRDDLVERCAEVGRILGSMISNPEKFCRYKKK